MVTKTARGGAATVEPKGRRTRKNANPDTPAAGSSWASREVPQEEMEGGERPEARQRLKLKCMTVNVPENVMDMLQLHADRRLDTLTTVVREALVKYLRETQLPPAIDFSITEH